MASLAAVQGGIVGREQMAGLAIPAWRVDNWVKTSRLHVWYRGVYAVGHRAVGAVGRRKAAQLAGGGQAALCCQTASDFLGIKPYASAAVHIWVPGQRGRTVDGIVAHRFADVVEADIRRSSHGRSTAFAASIATAW